MAYYIVRLDHQPVCANLHLRQPEQSRSEVKLKKRHVKLFNISKLSKPPSGCGIVREGNSLHCFSSLKASRRVLGELHVAKDEEEQFTTNPSPVVERGEYSYEVEAIIRNLNNLRPRGSIARLLEPFKKQLTMNDFSLIFREFAQEGEWQRPLKLFKYMQKQQWCKPNEHIYTIMIGILGREGLLDKCSEIFEQMHEEGVGWDVYSFTALINAYGRNGQYETSLHLLARMKRERITPNLITYNTIINACVKGGYDWEGLLGLFAQMRHEGIQPDIITYNSLLAACANRGLYNEAEMVFKTMNEAGIVPNTFTYTSVVETFAQAGLIDRVLELFREQELAGNIPDVTGYNLVLEAYAKIGIVKKAVGVFMQMQNAGCTPNASTYSTLISCYGKSGQYDDVRELFLSMKASSTEPDVVTYNTLIDVFVKGGYYQEVTSLYHDMLRENVEPVMETYNGVMLACAKGGLHEDAKQILRQIQNRGMIPSVEVFNSVIDAYGNAALYEDAVVIFDTMNEVGSVPNKDTYSSMIEMFARGGLDAESYEFIDIMNEASMEVPDETLNALIECSARIGDFDCAIEMFDMTYTSDDDLDEQAYEVILNVYCMAGTADMVEEGRTLFMEIKEKGLVPSIVSYCLMLSMYARFSRWDDAYELLEEMQTLRAPNALRVIGTMIKGDYDDESNWEMVKYVFDTLKADGVGVGMAFYNAVLDALWWLGQKARAARVLEEARKRNVFTEIFQKTKLVYSVDVHRMSIGAALTSVSILLIDIQRLAMKGEKIPQLASIVTVRGHLEKDKKGKANPVAQAVFSFLQDIKSPFSYVPWSKGRILCNKAQLEGWLQGSHIIKPILLKNSSLQAPGTRISRIYMQEVENEKVGKVERKEDKREEDRVERKEAKRKELTSV